MTTPAGSTPVARARASLDEQLQALNPAGPVGAEWTAAEATVQAIIDDGRTLEAFRGKPILDAFYDGHGKHSGMSKRAFAYAVAAACAGRPRLAGLVQDAARRIETYVPIDLVRAAEEYAQDLAPGPDTEAGAAVATIVAAREAWDEGQDLPIAIEKCGRDA